MKCLVTAAAGFIGSHLCERLLEAGHAVTGVVFIVGCARSSTTLLQRIVDAHPQIAILPPEDIERFEAAAGDLLEELGFPQPAPQCQQRVARIRELFTEDLRAREEMVPECW
jgi:thioester reductase-like protein